MRRNLEVRFSPGFTVVAIPPGSAAKRSVNVVTVAVARADDVRTIEAGRSGRGEPRMIAMVGVLRLATSSSSSGPLMLLLSCPSLKSTRSRLRPGASAVVSATARPSNTALLPAPRMALRVWSMSVAGGEKSISRRMLMLKGSSPQPIRGAEIRAHLPQGAAQLVERGAGDAGAHIEQQGDVDRQLFVGDVSDLLGNAVVEQLEIRGGQSGHRLALVLNRGVHADDVGAGTEHRRRLLRRRLTAGRSLAPRGGRQDGQRQDGGNAGSHRPS